MIRQAPMKNFVPGIERGGFVAPPSPQRQQEDTSLNVFDVMMRRQLELEEQRKRMEAGLRVRHASFEPPKPSGTEILARVPLRNSIHPSMFNPNI